MKTHTQLDMYRERMQEIVRRLDVVEVLLRGEVDLLYLPPKVECIYLQFRHVLELIATASLSVNQGANAHLSKEGRKKWHAGHILEAVETVNPEYFYPQPIRLVEANSGSFKVGVGGYRGRWDDFHGDYLSRDKFTTLYNACSRLLHTPNPLDGKSIARNRKIYSNQLKQAGRWRKRIVELLTHHKFRPAGQPQTKLFVCHTVGPDAEFQVAEFEMTNLELKLSPRANA